MKIVQLDSAIDPKDMRAAIYKACRDDAMIRNLWDASNYLGLSSEDRYTALAYHALKDRQRLMAMVENYCLLMPTTKTIVNPGDLNGN